MSYFAFKRDGSGNMLVTDHELAEAFELLLNHVILQTEMMRDAFDSDIQIEDVDHE